MTQFPNDYKGLEDLYLDAREQFTRATTDKERDDALMIALWALDNLSDRIEKLREQLVVTS